MSKQLNTRIQNKIDSGENWANSDLVALKGEFIVTEDAYGNHISPSIRIGDGEHKVSELMDIGGIPIFNANLKPNTNPPTYQIQTNYAITGLDNAVFGVIFDKDTSNNASVLLELPNTSSISLYKTDMKKKLTSIRAGEVYIICGPTKNGSFYKVISEPSVNANDVSDLQTYFNNKTLTVNSLKIGNTEVKPLGTTSF